MTGPSPGMVPMEADMVLLLVWPGGRVRRVRVPRSQLIQCGARLWPKGGVVRLEG